MTKKRYRLSIDFTRDQYLLIKKNSSEKGISIYKLISEALELQDAFLKHQSQISPSKKEKHVDLDNETFEKTIDYLLAKWSDFAAKLSKL